MAAMLDWLGLPVPDWMNARIQHMAPGNPIERRPGGGDLHIEEATTEHLLQLRDYYRSFKPEGQAGAPVKNIHLARRAYQLHLDGKKNIDICRELFPDSNLYDRKVLDAIRKRVRRLIENGGLHPESPSS